MPIKCEKCGEIVDALPIHKCVVSGWPEDRLKELDDLRDLLILVRGLNNGSNFINQVEKCIEMANKLDRTDYKVPRISFSGFLTDQAYKKPTT